MGALTADRPKPMVEVAGRPLIDHALDLRAAVQPVKTVVNLHYKAEMLRDHLADADVTLSDETDLLRETGGGLRHALPLLGSGPVFTLNSDAVWAGANPLAALQAAWDPDRMDALMAVLTPQNALGHKGEGWAFDIAPDGRLSLGGTLIYSGVQIIKTTGLAAIKDEVFSLKVLWERMLEDGRLYGLLIDPQWCDVGHPASIPLAEAMLRGTDV